MEKHRVGNEDRVEAANIIGHVEGKTALIIDDEIGTGGTVVAAADALKEHGAEDIYCGVTHAVFSGDASRVLMDSVVKELVVTDTLDLPAEKRNPRIKVLSVASLLGEAIHRIHHGLSVGALFLQ